MMENPFVRGDDDEGDDLLDQISEAAINTGVEHLIFHGNRNTPMMLLITKRAEEGTPARDAAMMYQALSTALDMDTMRLLTSFFLQHHEFLQTQEIERNEAKEARKKSKKNKAE